MIIRYESMQPNLGTYMYYLERQKFIMHEEFFYQIQEDIIVVVQLFDVYFSRSRLTNSFFK